VTFFHFSLWAGKFSSAGKKIDMKLLYGVTFIASQKILIVSVAVAAMGLPSIALAETDTTALWQIRMGLDRLE